MYLHSKKSIKKVIIVTFVIIMLLSKLIIGTIIFSNWFSYADNTLNDIFTSLDVDESVIKEQKAELASTLKYNIKFTIVIWMIAILLAIIIYYGITNYLLRPIGNLLQSTERFANGDLTHRVEIVRNDEVGVIAKAFNDMADTIYDLVNDMENKIKARTLKLEKANEELIENRNHLQLILDSTAEAIFGIDEESNCTFYNASGIKMLGYEQDELIGKNIHYLFHHTKRDGTPIPLEDCEMLKTINTGISYYTDDDIFWKKDGTHIDVEYHAYPQFKDGKVIGAVVTFMDITETKRAQEHIRYLNYHDTITGLYNRAAFEAELEKTDKDENLPLSIIYGDVNGLKLLNDMLGHHKGDELLRKTAEVIRKVCRNNDIISRVGGDEFVVLLSNTDLETANKIVREIKAEISLENIGGIRGSISIGTAVKTESDQDIWSILKNAEEAMYTAKTMESRHVSSSMLKDIMDTLSRKSPKERLHRINVSRLSEEIASNMKLSENEVRRAKFAGFYHDIGKITLNERVLNKEGKLNEVESEEYKRHPLIGYRILNLFNETLDIAEAVFYHHERWDGKGYPKGLEGDEIPIAARIVAVAEAYDSMRNMKGSNGATHEEALEAIRAQAGRKYDPIVVANLFK
jgi:diguanylate cyclase (GGDEF)-like protein/PAS domain S-box-containing protein